MKIIILQLIVFLFSINTVAQQTKKIEILPGEKWWGGATGVGYIMPFEDNTDKIDLRTQNFNNQTSLICTRTEQLEYCQLFARR